MESSSKRNCLAPVHLMTNVTDLHGEIPTLVNHLGVL